jgi:hypothetical protein
MSKSYKTSRYIFFIATKLYINRYRSDVLTLDALYSVTNLVRRVWRAAPGPVSTRRHAKCPARRLAIVCHAINVAPRPSLVATDVQEFVVKCVQKGIATNVLTDLRLESTFSR